MSIADRIAAAQSFDAADFVPFTCDGMRVGLVRRDHVALLARFPGAVTASPSGVAVAAALRTFDARSAAFARMLAALRDAGVLRGWRDERYAVVTGFGNPPYFEIERAAARMFGIGTFAVHVNGFTGRGAGRAMWIGRRSASKPIDPGLLDNLVGGGIASGSSLAASLVKEGYEEAGLDAARMATAVPAGSLGICRAVPEGLQAETIFVYRLELPENVMPRNTDGEVDGFLRVPVAEVAAMLRADAPFTVDAALVACAGLLREGTLTLEEAGLVSTRLADAGPPAP